MKSLRELIPLTELEKLASRSNWRYGQDIAENDVITPLKTNTFNITATVQHSGKAEKRTVELSSTSKGLRWKCTCTGRKDLFCQHCVAVGISLHQ